MKLKLTLTITACLLICSISYSQDFEEVYKAVASDRDVNDFFSSSVSLSGNYAIIGTYYEDEDASGGNTLFEAGSAYIFERDYLGNWQQVQKIVPSDRYEGDYFGYSVSIAGTYAIVGAMLEDEDATGGNTIHNAGSAYIFERDGAGIWNEVQKIVASDRASEDYFGVSVGISENFIIVGAGREDEDASGGNTLNDAGSAYIFERDENGIWQEIQKIVATDREPDNNFGVSVGISGNYILIGVWKENEDALGGNTLALAGSAYIFERNGSGTWNQVQKIVASDRAAEDHFGSSVDISGDYIIAGAPEEDENSTGSNTLSNSGSVYIFERNGSGEWNESQKIVASDREVEDRFGVSAGISGIHAIVGAYWEDEDATGGNTLDYAGSAYIFKLNESGIWQEMQKIVASDRAEEDVFGNTTAISGDYIIIGARSEDEDASGVNTFDNAGSAYIFESCIPDNTSDPRNVIDNASFETCVFNPWALYNEWSLNAIATYQLIDGTCIVTPSHLAASPEIWHIQLLQPFSAAQLAKLEAGEVYNLRFDAWSEEDNTDCSVFLGMDEEPWTSDLDDLVLLSTSRETYSFDFTLHEVYSSIKLAFSTGTETTWVVFDNVKLMKKSLVGLDSKETNTIKIWPNPVSDYIHIQTEPRSVVTLYNSLGMLVQELTLTEGWGHINVSGLAKGMYLVRIRQNNTTRVEKVIVE